MNNNIYVTQPSLAPLNQFNSYLQQVWQSGIVTHNGPLVQQLEKQIDRLTQLNNTVVVTNGTIALQLAIRALGIESGEIITTPFSWIATASAIRWERCEPVFVDIDPETFNINPNKIEQAITNRTKAIMPVHVFSNPADIDAIQKIATKHNLPVIYDAAHAFGVRYKGADIMKYGDISCTSFHATKIYNSGEGGACFANSEQLTETLKQLRFFGHNNQKDIDMDGLNGKMTEIHAALGLANLPYLTEVIEKRKQIYSSYRKHLNELENDICFQQFNQQAYNYSYMPLVFKTEAQLLKVLEALQQQNIFPRRYFYPALNTIKQVKAYSPMPKAENLAKRIACMPSYNELDFETIEHICSIIRQNL